MKFITLSFLSLFLVSCAGYQMGGAKPARLKHVQSINVPLFENDTLLIRAGAYATNSAVDAITRDGTYRITTAAKADGILEGRVSNVNFSQVRSRRLNSLSSEELRMEITLSWVLRDGKNPTKILMSGKSSGSTRFFALDNLRTARTNALPDALRRASEAMTGRLADGF